MSELSLNKAQTTVDLYAKACRRAIRLIEDAGIRSKLESYYDKYSRMKDPVKKKNAARGFINVINKYRKKHFDISVDSIIKSDKFSYDEKTSINRIVHNLDGLEIVERLFEEYVSACDALRAEKEYAEMAKQEAEARKKAQEDRKNEREAQKRAEDMALEQQRMDEEWAKKGGNHELQREVNDRVSEYLSRTQREEHPIYSIKYGNNTKLAEDLGRAYPEIRYSLGYYSLDNFQRGLDIMTMSANIEKYSGLFGSRKKGLRVDELDELAVLVLDTLSEELLGKSETTNINLSSLFDKLKLRDGLVKYKKAYDIVESYLGKLDSNERNLYFSRDSKQIEHLRRHGIKVDEKGLITPEELTIAINHKVANTMVSEALDYVDDAAYSKISHATRYMSFEEMIMLYRNMSSKLRESDQFLVRSGMSEDERKTALEKIEQRNSNLQKNFVIAMAWKLSSDKKLSMEESEILYAKITREYLHEDLKFEVKSTVAKHEASKERTSENTAKVTDAKRSAASRCFGMSKLHRVISKITGEWRDFDNLMIVDEMSVNQDDQLDKIRGSF